MGQFPAMLAECNDAGSRKYRTMRYLGRPRIACSETGSARPPRNRTDDLAFRLTDCPEVLMSARLQPEQQQRQPGREREMRPQPDYEPKYPGCGKLKNRVALITGGDSGIGRATAVAMAREGAKIAIVYLEEHEDADETLRLVERE